MKAIIKGSIFLGLISLSTSCLNDEMALDPENSTNVIEFKNPAEFASPFGSRFSMYTLQLNAVEELEIPVTVSYSGAHVAPEDITVEIGLNPDAIADYNAEQEVEFVPAVSDIYSIETPSVTIPKGQRTAQAMIRISPLDLDFKEAYVIPLQITSASYGEISANFGTILLNVTPKNIYDGVYEHTYTTNDPNLGSGTNTLEMLTVDANTVTFGLLGVYPNVVNLIVNPETNAVEVEMETLLPIATDASSKWDPETKTFTLKWTSNGGGREFEETFRWIGNRGEAEE